MVNNPMLHAQTKQMSARYLFGRDRVQNEKEIVIRKVEAIEMGADMLTKHMVVWGQ